MRQLERELREQVPEFGDALMSPLRLKSVMFLSEVGAKGRDYEGKAKRKR